MTSQGTQLEKRLPEQGGQVVGRIGELHARILNAWTALSAAQRKGAITAAGLLACLITVILYFGLRTDWRTLYEGLDPEDAREIGTALTQAQISFDVEKNGTGIRVPAELLDKARLASVAKGGLKSGRMGFELFDKPNWVGSEFDEKVNYQRALEGELEHTVGSLADVQSARVHLVLAHDSLFREDERPAKASVVLKLRRTSLADGEADAIRNLVAAAVDGLTPDRVVLVDGAGHLPLGPKSVAAQQLSAEQALEEKLISTLEAVTGPGNVRASVTLDYDPQASEETRETYDPTQSATLSMQRTEQTTGPEPVAAGIPGTASNAPNSQAVPVYPRQTPSPQTSKAEAGTYGVSKTVRHLTQGAGRVRRMTAAVVVNDRMMTPSSKSSAGRWEPRTAEELRNLTVLAQAAVGFDSTRGDVVTVQDMAFDLNRLQPQTPLPMEVLNKIENYPDLIRYAALLLAIFVVLGAGVRPALARLSKRAAEPARVAGTRATVEIESAKHAAIDAAGPPAVDEDRVRALEILQQVTGELKREPVQSARLLQSWIHSE